MKHFLLCCIACCLAGCGAERIPAQLDGWESIQLANCRLPLVVGVDSKRPASSDALVAALRHANLFQEVDRSDRLRVPPDLVAVIEATKDDPNVIPVYAVFTLGVIPSTWERNGVAKVVFRNPSATKTVEASYVYQSTHVVGWAASLLLLSPDWGYLGTVPADHHGIYDRLALAIAQQAPQLRALAEH